MEDKVIELERKNAELSGIRRVLEEEVSDRRSTLTRVQKEHKNVVIRLNNELLERDSRLRLLEGECETLRIRCDRVMAQSEAYKVSHEKMAGQIVDLEGMNARKLSELEDEKAKYKMRGDRLKEQTENRLVSLEVEVNALRKQVREKDQEIKTASEKLKQANDESEIYRNQEKEENRKKINMLEKERESLQSELSELKATSKGEIRHLTIELQNQKKELDNAYRVCEQRKKEKEKLQRMGGVDLDKADGEHMLSDEDQSDKIELISSKLRETVATAKKNGEHYKRRINMIQRRYDAVASQMTISAAETEVSKAESVLHAQRLEEQMKAERHRREEAEILLGSRKAISKLEDSPVRETNKMSATDSRLQTIAVAEKAQADEVASLKERFSLASKAQRDSLDVL